MGALYGVLNASRIVDEKGSKLINDAETPFPCLKERQQDTSLDFSSILKLVWRCLEIGNIVVWGFKR